MFVALPETCPYLRVIIRAAVLARLAALAVTDLNTHEGLGFKDQSFPRSDACRPVGIGLTEHENPMFTSMVFPTCPCLDRLQFETSCCSIMIYRPHSQDYVDAGLHYGFLVWGYTYLKACMG